LADDYSIRLNSPSNSCYSNSYSVKKGTYISIFKESNEYVVKTFGTIGVGSNIAISCDQTIFFNSNTMGCFTLPLVHEYNQTQQMISASYKKYGAFYYDSGNKIKDTDPFGMRGFTFLFY
jgi:hypothetical protein